MTVHEEIKQECKKIGLNHRTVFQKCGVAANSYANWKRRDPLSVTTYKNLLNYVARAKKSIYENDHGNRFVLTYKDDEEAHLTEITYDRQSEEFVVSADVFNDQYTHVNIPE